VRHRQHAVELREEMPVGGNGQSCEVGGATDIKTISIGIDYQRGG
jgi:hypothetical protein